MRVFGSGAKEIAQALIRPAQSGQPTVVASSIVPLN